MILIAIDPGTHISGLAIFKDKVLIHAEAVKVTGASMHARVNEMVTRLYAAANRIFDPRSAAELVMEWPRIYPQRRKEDPNDLLPLAGVVCAFRVLCGPTPIARYPAPSDWKQQRPKKIIMAHVMAKLSEAEKLAIDHPKDNNCVEAAGIGLWGVNRL